VNLVPGRLVGRFGVEARLGAGASAQVFRLRDRRSGALRALKVLGAPTAARRARFEREMALLQSVRHPNVVGVEGVVEVGGSPALVMEYVAGPSLAEALRAGPLTPAEADAIARGVIAGVGALHAAGIVHRDLKPANILLAREGERWVPKVADLGVARRVLSGPGARLTRTGEALSTPPYMAPEQIRDSSRVDHRADIWALGVILYELVCGQRPFPGRTLQEVAHAIERGPPAPRSLFPAIPRAWEDTLLAALQHDSTLRPSADAVTTLWGRVHAADLPARLPGAEPGDDEPLSTLALGEPTLAPQRANVHRPRHNLPWEADAFIGREAELAALAEMLARGAALVSVVGTGGVGKTRLVRRFAWRTLDDWPGGVWFCDLSEARSLEGICTDRRPRRSTTRPRWTCIERSGTGGAKGWSWVTWAACARSRAGWTPPGSTTSGRSTSAWTSVTDGWRAWCWASWALWRLSRPRGRPRRPRWSAERPCSGRWATGSSWAA